MASNFYYGGHPTQNANMLTYPLKSLSIGPIGPSSHPVDLGTGHSSPESSYPHSVGPNFNFNRSFATGGENNLPPNFRLQARSGGLPDFLASQFAASNSTNRPSILSGVSSNGLTTGNLSSQQGSGYKISDRLRTTESGGFRGSAPGHSVSRVLSNLQDSTHTPYSGNAYTEACAAFMRNQYGGTGDTGFVTEGSNSAADGTPATNNLDRIRSGRSLNEAQNGLQAPGHSVSRVLSNLQDSTHTSYSGNAYTEACAAFLRNQCGGTGDTGYSTEGSNSAPDGQCQIPQPYNNLLPSSIRSTTQSAFQSHTLGNSSLDQPPMESGNPLVSLNSEDKLSPLNPLRPTFSASHYYSTQQLENSRQLQASGNLKTAAWILVPPVPETTAAHMRTGRVHELKSRACSDRVFNASYMDHELKQVLHNKIQACLFTGDETIAEKLPRNLGAYTDLVPLEVLQQPRVSVTFGLPCVCFKAWSPRFNRPMLLRRVVLPTSHEAALSPDAYFLAKQLSEVDHPAVIGFRDIFFTNAFDDNSAVVVYEFTPCSSTLQQTHMSDPMKLTSFSSPFNVSRTIRPHSSLKNGPSDLGMLPETVVWSYLVQLTHALRFIHQQVHRACGVLDPTKVLLQDGTRLRVNCFGLKDVLFHNAQDPNIAEDQAADFIQLGKLILGVACGTAEAIQTSQRTTSFNLLQRTYRPELVNLIRSLISGQITGVDQLAQITAPFAYDQLTRVMDHADFLERQLFLGMECDRLFRLVSKLQSIVERNDRNPSNPDWSETGDRYMLKLFRDFLFHQTDQLGAPYLDLAHVISTLNKVEAGSTERLCLVSRDSQNVIIVTYADVKQWLDSSFNHLVERHRQSRCELRLAQQREARQQAANTAVNPTETTEPKSDSTVTTRNE